MVSINQIKQLRQETGVSISECKKALEETKGDNEKAKEIFLKEKRKAADKNALYILNRLWQEYKSTKSGMKCIVQDVSGYNK